MPTRHTITHAEEVYKGNAYHPGYNSALRRRGVEWTPMVKVELGQAEAADVDAIATSQTPAGGGEQELTLDGAKVSSGVATLDVARNVTITSAADETARTFTVTGEDEYGESVVEEITGVNASTATGAKAFYKISSVKVDANTAGAVQAGMGTVLGLPFRLTNTRDLLFFFAADTEEKSAATVAAGVSTTATATTGDVRGTVDPSTAPDGSTQFTAWMHVADDQTKAGAFGVDQYAG